MESKVSAKGKASRTHLVTYLLLITIVFVVAVLVGYRSYQHLYYRQGSLRGHENDDEESLQRHQQQQQPDEYSSLLRSDYMQRDAGDTIVSEQADRGLVQTGILNSSSRSSSSGIPGNNNTTKTATMAAPTPTPKIRIHQLDPSIAYSKRLIAIGDVHGCIATLEALLEKLSFTPDRDHLIFTGDIINKGPDSVGVVEFARKYGASAVRGNHEDKILKLRSELGLSNGHLVSNGDISHENEEEGPVSGGGEDEDEDDISDSSSSSDSGKDKKKEKKLKKEEKKEKKKLKKEQQKKDKKDKKEKKGKGKDKKDKKTKKKDKSKGKKGKEKSAREQYLAQLLSPDQFHWLESLPIILRVGQFPDMGETIVVHAGLVPGVPLEEQDPWDAMNMRSIDREKGTNEVLDTPDGTMWANLFNEQQANISAQGQTSQLMTVIYGHDARSSLRIEKYTKGLDTACIKGGKLTAFVIEKGGKQSVVQVPCVDNIEGAD